MMDPDEFKDTIEEIGKCWMPFGKYGPKEFPPRGIPLIDLPPDYLHYFKTKGWPKGRLGELMEIVYQAKCDGADTIFDEIRTRNGGRAKLRKPRKKDFDFGES